MTRMLPFRAPRRRRLSIGPALRLRVLRRDRYTCQYCGHSAPDVALEVDHRVPVARGGDNAESNLVTACTRCNRGKGAALGFRPAAAHRDLFEALDRATSEIDGVFDDPAFWPGVCADDPPPAAGDDVHWLARHCGAAPVAEVCL